MKLTRDRTDLEIDVSIQERIKYIKEKRQNGLPTFDDIFVATRFLDSKYRNRLALNFMWLIEDAGYGDSVERELCNLVYNYGRDEADLKARLWDMNFGTHIKMHSYNGWPLMKQR